MSLSAVRLAMMAKFTEIAGVHVPEDPLPHTIEDKTIIVFPRSGQSNTLSAGKGRGIAIQSPEVMQVEYHRRIPYEHLGSTMGDITAMIETITNMAWGELVRGKFYDTVTSIQGVSLVHFGALGWNEWTFGARIEVAYTHLTLITA